MKGNNYTDNDFLMQKINLHNKNRHIESKIMSMSYNLNRSLENILSTDFNKIKSEDNSRIADAFTSAVLLGGIGFTGRSLYKQATAEVGLAERVENFAYRNPIITGAIGSGLKMGVEMGVKAMTKGMI